MPTSGNRSVGRVVEWTGLARQFPGLEAERVEGQWLEWAVSRWPRPSLPRRSLGPSGWFGLRAMRWPHLLCNTDSHLGQIHQGNVWQGMELMPLAAIGGTRGLMPQVTTHEIDVIDDANAVKILAS